MKLFFLGGVAGLAAVAGCSLPRTAIVPSDFDGGPGHDAAGMDAGIPPVDAPGEDMAMPPVDMAMPPVDMAMPPVDTGPTCVDSCMGTTAYHCTGPTTAVTTPCTASERCQVSGGVASCVALACTPSSATCSADTTSLITCDATGSTSSTMHCDRGCTMMACRGETACARTVGPTIVAPGSMVIDVCGQGDDNNQAQMFGDCPDHGPDGEDVIVRLDIDHTERVTIDAADVADGSPVDPCIYVRNACGDITSEVDCSDDGGPGLDSRITDLVLTAGEYFLIVDSWDYTSSGTHYSCGAIQVTVATSPL